MKWGVKVLGAAWLLTAPSAAAADALPSCVPGLSLGVRETVATELVIATCGPILVRALPGLFRVSVVGLPRGVVVTTTRTDPKTGTETSFRLETSTAEAALGRAASIASAFAPNPNPIPTPTPTPIPTPDPIPIPDPNPNPNRDPTAVVTIRSPAPVQLQRLDAGRWTTACLSPCRADLPRTADYRIVDAGGHPLDAFRLDPTKDEADVVVASRSTALDAIGISLTAVGGLAVGAGLLGAGRSDATPPILGGLLGVLIGGGVLLANGSHVTVRTPATKPRNVGGNLP